MNSGHGFDGFDGFDVLSRLDTAKSLWYHMCPAENYYRNPIAKKISHIAQRGKGKNLRQLFQSSICFEKQVKHLKQVVLRSNPVCASLRVLYVIIEVRLPFTSCHELPMSLATEFLVPRRTVVHQNLRPRRDQRLICGVQELKVEISDFFVASIHVGVMAVMDSERPCVF